MARRARLASRDPALVKQSSTTAPQHRRHPSGTRPASTARHNLANACPAAWPGRPCAPLLVSARTPPARSAPGWAHRLGSPVLPVETPGLGHRSDSGEAQKLADPGTFRKKEEI